MKAQWGPLANVFHHQVKSQGHTRAKCMGAWWFYKASELNGNLGGSPLQNVCKPWKWILLCGGPCKKQMGPYAILRGMHRNPVQSAWQPQRWILRGAPPPCKQMETLWNHRVSPAKYMELHWYLEDHLFFQNERRSDEIVSKGTLAKCMQTTKLVRRGVRCKMIGLASEIPMGIWWNPKGCPCKAYSGHPLIS